MTMLPTLRVKSSPPAVGRRGEVLGAGGTVERHHVDAATALDGVAPVARVPDELVVAAGRGSPCRCPGCRRRCRCPDPPRKSSAPEPPSIRSSPLPPSIVVGMVSVNGTATPAVSSMRTVVVAAAGPDDDLVERAAVDSGLVGAVGAEVDGDEVRRRRRRPQREQFAGAAAVDEQRAVADADVHRRAGPVGRGRGGAGGGADGRGASGEGEDGHGATGAPDRCVHGDISCVVRA